MRNINILPRLEHNARFNQFVSSQHHVLDGDDVVGK